MTKTYLPERTQNLVRTFLKTSNLEEVARKTEVSTTTVYNIAVGKYPMNIKTKHVESALNVAVFRKLSDLLDYGSQEIAYLKELPEVQKYLMESVKT